MKAGDLQEELMKNVDKSLIRLLGWDSIKRYVSSVVSKRKEGQPVSFTDFFGHLVGETLLKGVSGV
jgi:phospholipase A2